MLCLTTSATIIAPPPPFCAGNLRIIAVYLLTVVDDASIKLAAKEGVDCYKSYAGRWS